jgi:hypothetical protein
MTVGELLQRTSSRELSEWKAYYRLQKVDQEETLKRMKLVQKAVQGLPKKRRR